MCSTEEKVERWEKVYEVLQKLTPHQQRKHFYMGYWGYKTECGTIGCAAGLCALDPWFIERGFKLEFRELTEFEFPKIGQLNITEIGELPVYPYLFFGSDGHERIFTNQEFTKSKGVTVYNKVMKEIKSYVIDLKIELGSVVE